MNDPSWLSWDLIILIIVVNMWWGLVIITAASSFGISLGKALVSAWALYREVMSEQSRH